MRMDPNTFYDLLEKVKPFITKQDTCMRESISRAAVLEATLIHFSTGCSYSSLQYSTRISKQNMSAIIPDMCQTIYDVLNKAPSRRGTAARRANTVTRYHTASTVLMMGANKTSEARKPRADHPSDLAR
ncbi:hypothetical protein E2C01_089565 [Portunus trituberculatus]|uniref:Nuclease HARBI1 n=1 Tax=Portunus trituberculatus TaxID=210409 RepID=A0A5B7JMR8_PORTR|nr:hypothetical protein [Portunus trituberculatus]